MSSSRDVGVNERQPLCWFATDFAVNPHIRLGDLADVRGEVVPQSLPGPRQRHPAEEDEDEQQVGEGSGEVNHLGTRTNKTVKS